MEDIKKIDIHAHVVSAKNIPPSSINIRAEQLLSVYNEINVEKAVLLPIISPEGQTHLMTNESVIEIVESYPDKFYWFCNVDPRFAPNSVNTDLSVFLNFYKEKGAKGVGELTSNLYFDDPKMDNLLYHCEECDMPILFHISPASGVNYGVVDEIGLPRLEKMLKKHPKLKFIGHSQPFWAEMSADITEEFRNRYPKGKVKEGRIAQLLREYDNLYCDLSAGSRANAIMRDPEYAELFLNEFADRILYGCDICEAVSTFPYKFSDFLENMREKGTLKEENYIKICRGNAEKILGLK